MSTDNIDDKVEEVLTEATPEAESQHKLPRTAQEAIDEALVNSRKKGMTGFSIMLNYIRDNHDMNVPVTLINDNTHDEDNIPLLVHAISAMNLHILRRYHTTKSLAVIEEMFPKWIINTGPASERDNGGFTPAMHWVKYFGASVPVPTFMRHSPRIRNNIGKTIAMIFLTDCRDVVNESLPEWMLHDLSVHDEDGFDLYDYWVTMYNEHYILPPKRPRRSSSELLVASRTILEPNEIWERHVPTWLKEYLFADREHRSVFATTPAMTWTIITRTPPPDKLCTLVSEDPIVAEKYMIETFDKENKNLYDICLEYLRVECPAIIPRIKFSPATGSM